MESNTTSVKKTQKINQLMTFPLLNELRSRHGFVLVQSPLPIPILSAAVDWLVGLPTRPSLEQPPPVLPTQDGLLVLL